MWLCPISLVPFRAAGSRISRHDDAGRPLSPGPESSEDFSSTVRTLAAATHKLIEDFSSRGEDFSSNRQPATPG